jgi:hypothetical protein
MPLAQKRDWNEHRQFVSNRFTKEMVDNATGDLYSAQQ